MSNSIGLMFILFKCAVEISSLKLGHGDRKSCFHGSRKRTIKVLTPLARLYFLSFDTN